MNMREPDAARPIAESRQSRAGRHGRRRGRGRPAMGVRAWRAKGRERGLPTDQPEKSAAAHFFLGRVTFSFFSRDDDDEHNNARRPLARLDRSEARMGGVGRRRASAPFEPPASAATLRTPTRVPAPRVHDARRSSSLQEERASQKACARRGQRGRGRAASQSRSRPARERRARPRHSQCSACTESASPAARPQRPSSKCGQH